MKRLIIGVAVAAAAGASFAQTGSAECSLGPSSPAWCYPDSQQQQPYVRRYVQPYGYAWGNRWDNRGYAYTAPWGVAQARRYGYVTPYPRTRRDRDGDGVPNRWDRHPDDPRYR